MSENAKCCNCCVCAPVCKYKFTYQNGIESILNTNIHTEDGRFLALKDYPHIEVSIKCPHMVMGPTLKK